ncbi:MAG: Lrp/AsnC family transcriptional regulator [Pseudomonadota bacterium]
MDQIDRRILAILQTEARIPVTDLAERVGLSATPCARRIARMEAAGIIRSYRARLDPAALGLPLTVFIFVELEGHAQGTLAAFETAVARFDEVIECHLMTGTRDVLIKVLAADLIAFDRFLEDTLLRVPGIRATRTSFSLRQMVSRDALPLGGD